MSTKSTSEQVADTNRARNKSALHVLVTVAEVKQGAFRDDGPGKDGDDVRHVSFSMLKDGPLTRAVLINGELFVAAIDAGTMDWRDRGRMLVVARSVANNA